MIESPIPRLGCNETAQADRRRSNCWAYGRWRSAQAALNSTCRRTGLAALAREARLGVEEAFGRMRHGEAALAWSHSPIIQLAAASICKEYPQFLCPLSEALHDARSARGPGPGHWPQGWDHQSRTRSRCRSRHQHESHNRGEFPDPELASFFILESQTI